MKYTYQEVKEKGLKKYDAWWTVLVADKFALPLTYFFANYTKITPNQISILKFLIKLCSAYLFLKGDYKYLLIGAFLYEIAFIFDCVDGKLARVTGKITKFGKIFDIFEDHLSYIFLSICLALGQKINLAYPLISIFLILLNDFYDFKKSEAKHYLEEREYILPQKFVNFLRKRRMIPIPSTIEATHVLFFFSPIFKFVIWGFRFFIVFYGILCTLKTIAFIKIKLSKTP